MKIPKDVPVFSKRDPNVIDHLVSWISSADDIKEFEALAKLTWEFIDRIDKKHVDTNHPYTDREVKMITEKANMMMHKCKKYNLDSIADQLFEAHTKLWFEPDKFSDTEKVIKINRIKDIIHQIFEPRHDEVKQKEEKKDLTIDGFPRFKKGKVLEQYRPIYEKRLFWFYDILKETKGENFADALLTMDHDHGEFFLSIAHIGYDEIAHDKIFAEAEKMGLISKDQRIKLLEALLYLFAMKILRTRDDPDEEKRTADLQKLFLKKYRKLQNKVDKKKK
jgi:hypothetical protein